MRHIQQCACGVALHAHILGLCETGQWTQRARPGDLCFILFMGRQIRDAADGVALDFYIRRHHLSYERRKATKRDYQHLVFS